MNFEIQKRLEIGLLTLRLSIFMVMFMWTIDKFIRVDHAKNVFEKFYRLRDFGNETMYGLAAIELILLVAFVIGFKKRWSYGLVLLFHGISTISSFNQYLNPFEGGNLLFFAAWPMLAASYTLYVLRDFDRRFCFIEGI